MNELGPSSIPSLHADSFLSFSLAVLAIWYAVEDVGFKLASTSTPPSSVGSPSSHFKTPRAVPFAASSLRSAGTLEASDPKYLAKVSLSHLDTLMAESTKSWSQALKQVSGQTIIRGSVPVFRGTAAAGLLWCCERIKYILSSQDQDGIVKLDDTASIKDLVEQAADFLEAARSCDSSRNTPALCERLSDALEESKTSLKAVRIEHQPIRQVASSTSTSTSKPKSGATPQNSTPQKTESRAREPSRRDCSSKRRNVDAGQVQALEQQAAGTMWMDSSNPSPSHTPTSVPPFGYAQSNSHFRPSPSDERMQYSPSQVRKNRSRAFSLLVMTNDLFIYLFPTSHRDRCLISHRFKPEELETNLNQLSGQIIFQWIRLQSKLNTILPIILSLQAFIQSLSLFLLVITLLRISKAKSNSTIHIHKLKGSRIQAWSITQVIIYRLSITLITRRSSSKILTTTMLEVGMKVSNRIILPLLWLATQRKAKFQTLNSIIFSSNSNNIKFTFNNSNNIHLGLNNLGWKIISTSISTFNRSLSEVENVKTFLFFCFLLHF